MEETPQAFLCHAVPGRTRIKVPDRRGDLAYFAGLERDLAPAPGVAHVSVRPMTGSVVILHDGEVAALAAHALDKGLFTLGDGEPQLEPVVERLRGAAVAADRRVRAWSGGGLDMATLMSLVLIVAALVQLRNGRLFGPASHLLWTAFGVLRMARPTPPPAEPEDE